MFMVYTLFHAGMNILFRELRISHKTISIWLNNENLNE